MRIKYAWLIILLLPFLFSSCNDTDDVQEIFTGRTWRLTYITKKNEHGWYKFPGVNESVYKTYDPITGSRKFIIDFTGNTVDDILTGDFTGNGAVQMNGTFMANGENNVFSTGMKSSSVVNTQDTLGKFIIEGMRGAYSYEGDTRNLFLYYEYNSEVLCLVFAPDN